MNIFNYLRRRPNTAAVAKERLQIIISHERSKNTIDYLPQLQEEILAVIAKYMPINREQVNVHLERMGSNAVLELNFTMSDAASPAEA